MTVKRRDGGDQVLSQGDPPGDKRVDSRINPVACPESFARPQRTPSGSPAESARRRRAASSSRAARARPRPPARPRRRRRGAPRSGARPPPRARRSRSAWRSKYAVPAPRREAVVLAQAVGLHARDRRLADSIAYSATRWPSRSRALARPGVGALGGLGRGGSARPPAAAANSSQSATCAASSPACAASSRARPPRGGRRRRRGERHDGVAVLAGVERELVAASSPRLQRW